MSKSDQSVLIIMLLLIVLYIAVWVTGYFSKKLPGMLAVLNGATAITILSYWVLKQLRIQQHYIAISEVVGLGLQLILVALAIYAMASAPTSKWLKIVQYVAFGIHLLALVAALIFMLTFKINRLM